MMNMQQMLGQFQGFMQNPMAFMLQSKLQIPKEYMNNPDDAIQYLMNTGKISQDQYNWARNQAKQLQNNPDFMKMFGQK